MPYKATKRLYLSVDGTRAVEEGDPQANTLLVNEGGELPLADARRYGLVQEEEAAAEPQAKAVDAAPANKAVKAPEGNK